MRPSRHDVLFESVRLGPVVAKNRFYQVPHCTGMGHTQPQALARLREIKAEGGWAVVSTEEVEISPLSEIAPSHQGRLWDDDDVPALELMTAAVHRHGALAAIELMFNGYATFNLHTREIPLAPSDTPVRGVLPIQARAMTKADIRELRRLHRAAALRARRAGFDVVYVYAGHDLGLPLHFLSPRHNRRTDEYGGPLENRLRLLRELVEDTRDAVGDRCAVAVRLAVAQPGVEGAFHAPEAEELLGRIGELPDLWDVNVADWSEDSLTARFGDEGFQERHVAFVKRCTSKPVVGVGRFTSPDAMVDQLRRGVLDLIGAARPSIADPFLPRKIEEGRLEDIRECIGCNVCAASDNAIQPIRCTQNPTMGDEWRRGWHPETIEPAVRRAKVLVVGAGPAGLECARALGQRGYEVAVADAAREPGGRLRHEARLPGLASWRRVVDWRLGQLGRLPNVALYLDSPLAAAEAIEFGADAVVVATGARWRRDGLGRAHRTPIGGLACVHVLTPDDLFAGTVPAGPVVVYDDDHYLMGSSLAERLRLDGHAVAYVTPAVEVATYTRDTMDQLRIQRRLLELGVAVHVSRRLASVAPGIATLGCIYAGAPAELPLGTLVLATSREPVAGLADELDAALAAGTAGRLGSVIRVGDCLAPGTVAAAVFGGHRAARRFDAPGPDTSSYRRERVALP